MGLIMVSGVNNWSDGSSMPTHMWWKPGDEAGENVNYLYPEGLLNRGLEYQQTVISGDGTILGKNYFVARPVIEEVINNVSNDYHVVDPAIDDCVFIEG